MIRLFSKQQAQDLRGTIPELAITRAEQFMGEGYSPENDGHIVVIQEGDDLSLVTEVSDSGLILTDSDNGQIYEFIEAHQEAGITVYEIVYQLDNERTVAVIVADGPWLDAKFRNQLLDLTAT